MLGVVRSLSVRVPVRIYGLLSPVGSHLVVGFCKRRGLDSDCQDKLIHSTLSSSHPEGASSPERGHGPTQMRQSPSWTRFLQSWLSRNLGRGGSAPLSDRPPRNQPVLVAILGAGGSLFCRPYAKGGSGFVPFGRLRSDPESDPLPVCARTTEARPPSEVGSFFALTCRKRPRDPRPRACASCEPRLTLTSPEPLSSALTLRTYARY